MKIVCTDNVLFAEEAFSTIGEVTLVPDNQLAPEHVKDADMLFTRSTVKINKPLLEGSSVRFAGTATIGFDHIDAKYMKSAGIEWRAAPGCNANSVGEYIVTALLCLAARHGLTLAGKTIGVVGVGNVGTKVVEKAALLGMRPLQNDPPRKDDTGDPAFLPLDTLLAESDIITMHVPLTDSGPHPTRGMVNESFFKKMKPGCIFINAARGKIMATDTLINAIKNGVVSHTILDTWENEPAVRPDIRDMADIATPHIAGHSFEGKAFGTDIIYREACKFIGIQPVWSCNENLEHYPAPSARVNDAGKNLEQTLWETVKQVYDITQDDKTFRTVPCSGPDAIAAHFSNMRKNYPVRREFRFVEAKIDQCSPATRKILANLGFKI